jgi:uncharacterized membrane protein
MIMMVIIIIIIINIIINKVEAKHSSSDPVSNIIHGSNPKVTFAESKKT